MAYRGRMGASPRMKELEAKLASEGKLREELREVQEEYDALEKEVDLHSRKLAGLSEPF